MDDDGQDDHLSHESSKRGRNDSPEASHGSKRSSKRSKRSSKRSELVSTIVRKRDERFTYLSRSGMLDKLLEKLFGPVGSSRTPFNYDPQRVTQQIEKFQTMIPFGNNIVLTDVKMFYFPLPNDVVSRKFKKMYRYVFFKFNDAIFSLHLPSVLPPGLSLEEDKHILFLDTETDGQICTLANLLASNMSVEKVGTDSDFDKKKNCRINGSNHMLRSDIKGRSNPRQEYDNLVEALQDANDSHRLQMFVPNIKSLIMLLLKYGSADDRGIKSIFRNNEHLHFPNTTLAEINAAIDKGIQITQRLQTTARTSDRGGSRRYSSKRRSMRKSRTVRK
jgi:hypothetical protein